MCIRDRDKSTATNDSSLEEYALLSFFGRINYAWKDRYVLEVNLRYDGSSRFADGHRWGLFPSVSAGWRISEEDVYKRQPRSRGYHEKLLLMKMRRN